MDADIKSPLQLYTYILMQLDNYIFTCLEYINIYI